MSTKNLNFDGDWFKAAIVEKCLKSTLPAETLVMCEACKASVPALDLERHALTECKEARALEDDHQVEALKYAVDVANKPPAPKFDAVAASPMEREASAKLSGMDLALSSPRARLDYCRSIARALARNKETRTVSSDDVRRWFEDQGLELHAGNWLGSLFKSPDWEPTSERAQATHKGGHCREVRVWRLKDGC